MKFPGEAAERVARSLIEEGPATIPVLAERLAITPAGARRQVLRLQAAGFVQSQDRPPYGPAPQRGRGRPASVFAITNAGRLAADDAAGDFAQEAVRFMAKDPQTLIAFARDRADRLADRLTTATKTPGTAPIDAIAHALTEDGYAATVEGAGDGASQLCQHHCPIVEIAAEFPQFCEAETEALSRVLGQHVTRLATIAHGDGVCTTLIPKVSSANTPRRSQRKVSA